MLDVPAATLIRTGGSFLLAIAGGMILALAKRDRGNLALGAFFVAEGILLTGNNLLDGHPTAGWVWVPFVLGLRAVLLASAAGLLAWWPGGARRGRRHLLVVAPVLLFVFGTYAWGWQVTDWAVITQGRTVPTPEAYAPLIVADIVLNEGSDASVVAFAAFAALRFAASAHADARVRRQLALVGVLILPGLVIGLNVLRGDGQFRAPGVVVETVVTILVVVPLWLRATRAPEGRLARNAALAIAGLAFLGALLQAQARHTGDFAVLDAAVGIQRSIFAFLLVYGVLRLGLLGYDPAIRTANRGTLAMASLAALFIVAQIAQNFLSAQYGLLMGGIVAGALLFAAAPIQRAIENSHKPSGGRTSHASLPGKEEAYRNALRIALRDRILTEDEEVHLAHLSDELGLTHRRAREIRNEVQREREGG